MVVLVKGAYILNQGFYFVNKFYKDLYFYFLLELHSIKANMNQEKRKMDLRNLVTEDEAIKPLIKRELPLIITYHDPEGERHQDTVISKVPDGDGKLLIERKMALLSAGPWENLSPLAKLRIEAIAVLSVQLVQPPEWLNKWAVIDDELLFDLREQLGKHANLYFRPSVGQGAGDSAVSRVAIYSKELA